MRSDFIVNADTINKMIQFGTVKYGIVKQLKDRNRSEREISSDQEENGTSLPSSPVVECSKSTSPIQLESHHTSTTTNTIVTPLFNNNNNKSNNNINSNSNSCSNHSTESNHNYNNNNNHNIGSTSTTATENSNSILKNIPIKINTAAEMLDTLPTSYRELDKINNKTPSPALADHNRIADQPPSSLMAGDDDETITNSIKTTTTITAPTESEIIMTTTTAIATATMPINISNINIETSNKSHTVSESCGDNSLIENEKDLSVNINNSSSNSNNNIKNNNLSDSIKSNNSNSDYDQNLENHKILEENHSEEKLTTIENKKTSLVLADNEINHVQDPSNVSKLTDLKMNKTNQNEIATATTPIKVADVATTIVERRNSATNSLDGKTSPQPGQLPLPSDFPQFPGGGPVTLDTIQNMQMAIAQFAAKTFANGGTEAPNEAAVKQLAFLQQTLFNLQQQQLFQIQLIQQLQSQLALNQMTKSQNASEQDQDEERDQMDDEDRDTNDLENGNSENRRDSTTLDKKHSSTDQISENGDALKNKNKHMIDDVINMDDDDDDEDDNDDMIEFKKFRPDEPLEYGEIRLPYRLSGDFSKDNIPLPYGGQDENRPLPYGTDLASAIITDHGDQPSSNSLEMLQKRAQEVLDSASAGILSGNLADEFAFGKDKNGDKNRNEPFFKHRCRYCGKVFGSDSALQIHIRSHTGERPFKCNVCGSRFTTKGNLKVHFQRHAQKFPHVPMNSTPIPEHLDKFHPPLLDQMSPDSSPTHQPSQMPSHIPNVPVSLPLSFPPGAGFPGLPTLYRPPLDILKSLGPYANPFFSGLPPMPPPHGVQSQLQQPQQSPQQQQHQPSAPQVTPPVSQSSNVSSIPSPIEKTSTTPPSTKNKENVDAPTDLRKSSSPSTENISKEEQQPESLLKDEHIGIKIKEEKKDVDEDECSIVPTPKRPVSTTPSPPPREPQIPPPQLIPSMPQRSPNQPLLAMPPHNAADLPMGSANLPPTFMTREELFEHHHRMQMSFRGSPDRGSPIRSPAGIPGLQRSPFLGPMKHDMALLPRPHSNDNSWENFIEVSNTSETMKLKELMKNKKLTDPNQCVVCDRVLSCKSALQMHYRTHTGERPFKCRICGRAFTTKGNLKTHMAVHKIRPPMRNFHQCPVCHKKYSNALVLQQHIRLHTGEPTDLTPEQISAAEIRDFPPSMMPGALFNPFNPFGFGMGPQNGHLGSESSLGELDDNMDCDDFDDDLDDEQMSNGGDSDRPKSSEEIKGMLFEQKLKIGNSLTNKSETSNGSSPTSPISVLNKSSPVPSDLSQGALDLTPRSTSITNNQPLQIQSKPLPSPPTAPHTPQNNSNKIEKSESSESLQRPPSRTQSNHDLFREQQFQRELQIQQFHHHHQQLQQQHQQALQQHQHSPQNQQQHLSMPSQSQQPHPLPPPPHLANAVNNLLPQRPPFGMFPNLPLFPPGMNQTSNMCSAMNTIAQSVMPAAPFNPLALSGVRGSTTCGICFKTFPCHSALEIHYRSHTKERPFKCTICDRGFTTKGNLKQHMLTHKIRDMEQDAFRNRAVKFEYMRGMKDGYE